MQINEYFTFKNIAFTVMLCIFIYFLSKITDIALMIFASFVLASTLLPLVNKLEKKMPRGVASGLIMVALILGIFLIFIPLAVFTLEQFALLIKNAPHYIELLHKAASVKIFGYSLAGVLEPIHLTDVLNSVSSKVLEKTISATGVVASSATGMLAIALMTFYICVDYESLKKGFVKLFPQELKEKARGIIDSVTQKVGGYVFAQLVSMIFVGVFLGFGLLLMGHKHALMLGFIAFALDLIPVVGPALAIILAIVTSVSSGIPYCIGVLVIFGISQVLENQFLRPLIFSKFMDINPLLVIVSLLVGAKFLGLWGVILAPVVASVFIVLIDELYIKAINQEEK